MTGWFSNCRRPVCAKMVVPCNRCQTLSVRAGTATEARLHKPLGRTHLMYSISSPEEFLFGASLAAMTNRCQQKLPFNAEVFVTQSVADDTRRQQLNGFPVTHGRMTGQFYLCRISSEIILSNFRPSMWTQRFNWICALVCSVGSVQFWPHYNWKGTPCKARRWYGWLSRHQETLSAECRQCPHATIWATDVVEGSHSYMRNT